MKPLEKNQISPRLLRAKNNPVPAPVVNRKKWNNQQA